MEKRCFPSCCCYFQKLDRRHYVGQHLVKNEDAQPDFFCIHLDEFRIIYVEGYKTWSFWMILIDTHSWHAFIIFSLYSLGIHYSKAGNEIVYTSCYSFGFSSILDINKKNLQNYETYFRKNNTMKHQNYF